MNAHVSILGSLQSCKPFRVLITGGAGMLGNSFSEAIEKYMPQCEVKALSSKELDVTQSGQLADWAHWIKGGWIIHCAALVNVEACLKDPAAAERVIVEGTHNVLRLAQNANAKLFYPQSFLVYDGKTNPIPENEELRPLSVYGNYKKAAEELILERMPDALIVKMAGFMGGDARDKNFVGRVIPHLYSLVQTKVPEVTIGDRVWQPTFTDDLALNSLLLIAADKKHSYQMAAHGAATFAELTQAIVDNFGWSDVLKVVTVKAQDVEKETQGRRPSAAILSCQRLRDEGLDIQRDWRSSLNDYLSRPYFDQFRNALESEKKNAN